jgi:hypothetical protein
MTISAESVLLPTEEGLRRRLVPRQIAMMAMGSAIGVGLFLGSTVTIRLAGPGVIVTYVFGAFIALVMGYALAEMAVMHPVAGSFGVFADRYPRPGPASSCVRRMPSCKSRHWRGSDGRRHLLRLLVPGVPPWLWSRRDRRGAHRDQHRTGRLVPWCSSTGSLIK